MYRIPKYVFLVLLCALASHTLGQSGAKRTGQSDVGKLKEKRLQLLQERVDIVDAHVREGRSSSFELVEPTIDLLHVKIEYATSNEDRRILYNQLLEQHDRLIEIAELRGKAPVPVTKTKLKLLYLKSKRIRIEIELESLG